MLDLITSKASGPDGQLGNVNIPSNIGMWPMFINRSIRIKDTCNTLLVCSQLDNIRSILELAESNLIYSSGVISQIICQTLYSVDDTNAKERIQSDFLLNSILYYNASFDYLKVALKFIYSSHDELVLIYSKEAVEKKRQKSGNKKKSNTTNTIEDVMQRLNLKRNWDLALGYCITKESRKYSAWCKENRRIKPSIKEAFTVLDKKNRVLKQKYQANQLKHGAVPHFKYSDPSNLIGSRIIGSLDQYYQCKKNVYSIARYENQLQIDEVQRFLITYHNCTVGLIDELLVHIGIDIEDNLSNADKLCN